MAEGGLAAPPAPLPTAADGGERVWAKPWCDPLVDVRRALLWVSHPVCPTRVGLSAGDVWAALVPYSIPVSADLFYICAHAMRIFLCLFLFYTLANQTAVLSVSRDHRSPGSPRVKAKCGTRGVTWGRAIGVAGRGIS